MFKMKHNEKIEYLGLTFIYIDEPGCGLALLEGDLLADVETQDEKLIRIELEEMINKGQYPEGEIR